MKSKHLESSSLVSQTRFHRQANSLEVKVELQKGAKNGGRWQIRTADLMRVMHAL